MWRIPLLAIASCFALQASPIVFTTCSVGDTTATPCPPGGLSDPPLNNVQMSVFVTAAQPTVNDIALVGFPVYFNNGCPPDVCPQPAASASVRLTVNDIDYTTGPERSGLIQVTASIDNERSESAGWRINDGVHAYVDCLPGFSSGVFGCMGTATVPFELGVPFSVNAVVANSIFVPPGQTVRGPSGVVQLMFTLFEADGTTPSPSSRPPNRPRTH